MNVLMVAITVMPMLHVPTHKEGSLVLAILDIWTTEQPVLVILFVWHIYCDTVASKDLTYEAHALLSNLYVGFRNLPLGSVPVSDVDECADGSHNCDANAACTNTQGEYTCTCKSGYMGDGATCSGNIIYMACLM